MKKIISVLFLLLSSISYCKEDTNENSENDTQEQKSAEIEEILPISITISVNNIHDAHSNNKNVAHQNLEKMSTEEQKKNENTKEKKPLSASEKGKLLALMVFYPPTALILYELRDRL
jgi:hypothetical protein